MSRRSLLAFAAKRLAALAVLLLVLSFLVFGMLYVTPGSAEQVLLGTKPTSPETLASIRAEYHLDEPFLQQYWRWLSDAARLDFGASIRSGRSVLSTISERLGVTVFLGVYGFLLATSFGLLLGILAALKQRKLLDRTAVLISILGASAPAFVTGAFLLYIFGVALGWFPAYGAGEGFLDRVWHLTLPAIALALSAMALIVKFTRTAMIRVLEQDYIGYARARGVPMRRVITHHALRNALIPIITATGLVLTLMLTGTVLVEVTFALPGLGSLLVEAVETKDVPMLQGTALLFAVTIVVINLGVDLLYAVVDPRIRFGLDAA